MKHMIVTRFRRDHLQPSMKLWCAGMAVTFAILSCGLAFAGSNKISNFLRQALDIRSKQIIAATTEMPADKFGFQPSPTDMTFAQLAIHVATTNYAYCSKIGDAALPTIGLVGPNESKGKYVDEVKSSFDYCVTVLAKLDDSNTAQLLILDGVQTTRAMAILTLTGAWNDHLTMGNDYLRRSGNVPVANN